MRIGRCVGCGRRRVGAFCYSGRLGASGGLFRVMTSMTSTMLVGLLAMAGATQADASGGSGSLQLRFNFEATVQADGSVADVQPDPALPASIQARVKQAAATWRYAPIRWQGQAIQVRIVQQVKVEATPRPEGGTALRIVEVVKPGAV